MPSLGMLTINAMTAANSVLIPVQPQFYAADGLTELLKVYKGTKQRFNPEIEIGGILFTMDASRYNNSKRNKKAVHTAYSLYFLPRCPVGDMMDRLCSLHSSSLK